MSASAVAPIRPMGLYDLVMEYRALSELVSDEEAAEQVSILLKETEGDIATKVDHIVCVVLELEASARALAEEVARLNARKKSMELRAKHLRERMRDALIAIDKTKVKGLRATVSVSKPGKPKVVVTDVMKLREAAPDFVRTRIEYDGDMDAIKRALDDAATLGVLERGVTMDESGVAHIPGVDVIPGKRTLSIR